MDWTGLIFLRMFIVAMIRYKSMFLSRKKKTHQARLTVCVLIVWLCACNLYKSVLQESQMAFTGPIRGLLYCSAHTHTKVLLYKNALIPFFLCVITQCIKTLCTHRAAIPQWPPDFLPASMNNDRPMRLMVGAIASGPIYLSTKPTSPENPRTIWSRDDTRMAPWICG